MRRRFAIGLFSAVVACLPLASQAYSNIYFFGDSLTDSGNNFLALGGLTTPTAAITGNTFIPTFPYSSLPHPFGRYSNSLVWADTFAAAFGSAAVPSLAAGNNFAFGGANTGPLWPSASPSLRTQVSGMFLPGVGGDAPSDALYVIAGGGNNARNALDAVAGGADPTSTLFSTALAYAVDTAAMITDLRTAGADEFIVWTTPNVGKAPAVMAAGAATAAYATQLSGAMNQAMLSVLHGIPGLDAGVKVFDLFAFLNQVTANPGTYGLDNVTDACGAIVGCDPSKYLFWDGIHPTSAGHALIAQANIALVPEPSTYAMLLLGIAFVGVVVRARASPR